MSRSRTLALCCLGFLILLACPLLAAADDGHAFHPHPVAVAPFALLLLCVAVLPLVSGHWWHENKSKIIVASLLAAPIVVYLVVLGDQTSGASTHALVHELQGYFSFIVLLGALYTVSGGIVLTGDIRPTPARNTALMAFGAALANLIGTTGASMLLIRPLLRINAQRTYRNHLVIFFIFTVSNVGGLLTPLGDPPLFLGFLKGVDFFWTFQLWPQWLTANGILLGLFFCWDTLRMRQEQLSVQHGTDALTPAEPLRVQGKVNFLLLGGILAAVLLQSEDVGRGLGGVISRVVPCPDLTLSFPAGEGIMILMALLSLVLTSRELRIANGFTWAPIAEVAIIFAGLFVTMVPALELLKVHGQEFGISQPWQYFWVTGTLSSFLDNAPTYLALATMAAGPEASNLTALSIEQAAILRAISCGAVFMGANTYIGNGPNFMVKAIADEAGVRMPSFFGYVLYALCILIPVWILTTYIFFRPAL